MKRNGPECLPISQAPADPPTKARRPQKESSPRAAARARAPATTTTTTTEKHFKGVREEEGSRPETAALAGAECSSSLPESAAVEAAGGTMWDVGAVEFGGWWGAEEEKLLGWYPFAAEHFLGDRNGGGAGGLSWEEEEEEDRDIWQLQHIHEIPNRAK